MVMVMEMDMDMIMDPARGLATETVMGIISLLAMLPPPMISGDVIEDGLS